MKTYLYILIGFILVFSVGCSNNKEGNKNTKKKAETIEIERETKPNPTSSHEIDSILNLIFKETDTVIVYSQDRDTISYSKEELQDILFYFPEINDKYSKHPDIAYSITMDKPIDNIEFDSKQFGSEIGQDDYFILYAYLLKYKNGINKYKGMRDTLIQIYRRINGINEGLAEGGTYFGHQHRRIVGYAEHSIYQSKNNSFFIKQYSITKQKKLFLSTLQQRITDEENINAYAMAEKAERKKQFDEYVNKLDSLITNYFYLKMAQEFQYSNY